MINKIICMLCLQLLVLLGSAHAAGVTVTVAPEVYLSGDVITLGQIAQIGGDDETLVQALQAAPVGNAPAPGSSIMLTREMLAARLASFTGVRTIVWNLPEAVTITGQSQRITGQMLADCAVAAVKKQIGTSLGAEDYTIAPSGIVNDLYVAPGKTELKATLPYGIQYNLPTTAIVAVLVDGKPAAKTGLKLDVKVFQQVVVIAGAISPRDLFSTLNLRYERMDTGKLGTGYFTDMQKVLGMEAKRPLAPGMVLTESMLNKPLLVKRGYAVTIVARIGNMEVSAAGLAMQDGSEGQMIRVQNLASARIITAKVIDGNTVQALTYKN